MKFNFQTDGKYSKENCLCQCGRIQSQRHLESCSLFSDLRDSLDLSDPDDLVDYFDEVLKRLENDEKEEDINSTVSDDESDDDDTS